jgi:heme A synthase
VRFDRALAAVTILATLLLIAIGSLVRTTGSGLGCPDWPLCYGSLIPPAERTAIIEWSHRTVAALVGLLIVAFAARQWWLHRNRRTGAVVTLLLLLLGVQAILGRITVERELPPEIVAAHMVTAMVLLGLLVALAASRLPLPAFPNAPAGIAVLAAAAAGLVISVGAYSVATHAGFACTSWPGCPEATVPFLDGMRLQHIHWLHRLAALAGLASAAWLWWEARGLPRWDTAATVLLALYAAQVLAGGLVILIDFRESVRILHLALAGATWAVAVAIATSALAGRQRRTTADPELART